MATPKKFQDTWDAKFPWAKPIIGEDGKYTM
jgi:hypothetical protein